MINVKALIERGKGGAYGVYIDLKENRLNYGIIGDGNTVNEAIKDRYQYSSFCQSTDAGTICLIITK